MISTRKHNLYKYEYELKWRFEITNYTTHNDQGSITKFKFCFIGNNYSRMLQTQSVNLVEKYGTMMNITLSGIKFLSHSFKFATEVEKYSLQMITLMTKIRVNFLNKIPFVYSRCGMTSATTVQL